MGGAARGGTRQIGSLRLAAARPRPMASADSLISKITASELQPVHVDIVDTSDGCGSKFNAIIVAATFDGMSLLERQRAVNEVIKEEMESIHAFSMKTWTPAQYEEKKKKP